MFCFDWFNIKKISIVRFFLDFFPMLSFFSSISSLALIFFFLKNISMSDVFMEIDISVYILFSIFMVFMVFIISILLPFYTVNISFDEKLKINGKFFTFFCSLTRSIMILLLLSFLFLAFNVDGGYITLACFILTIPYLIVLLFLNDEKRRVVLSLVRNSIHSYLFFFSMFFLMVVILSNDNEIFKFVLCYLFFLLIFDCVSIIEKREGIFLRFIPVLFLLFIFLFIDGFKFQKAILKVFGGTQDSSQAGWYLVKNRATLDYFPKNHTIYTIANKNNTGEDSIRDINYYIYGYLIFNVANVRIICPRGVENKKNDFLKCLSLTDEDIKFMGRSLPNNASKIDVDSSTALMTVRALMTVKAFMEVKLKAVKH